MDDRTKEYVTGFSDVVNDGAEYVVVGWHPAFFDSGNGAERDVQYASAATQLAQGARLVITSDEADVPIEGGSIPGTHSMVSAILDNVERQYGTDARERSERGIVNVGKPGDISYQVLESLADGENVLMVGDSLNTDILGAARNGMDAALTLTGNAARYRDDADALDADLSSYGIDQRPHLLRTIDELVR
ncbi:MAG: HAD hydrolase-like protein [Candidatus Undinarchaeales archaeon]|jgi:ribonucleotide monophosphatase NagD (HAD superfamily)|nr:HAD hydrolase-like protein [Candidatus Undinarchaeales archaeon]MDP7492487.1 HAD hydrolase-like protein [Candidatus Undinarchaeales archaeon]